MAKGLAADGYLDHEDRDQIDRRAAEIGTMHGRKDINVDWMRDLVSFMLIGGIALFVLGVLFTVVSAIFSKSPTDPAAGHVGPDV